MLFPIFCPIASLSGAKIAFSCGKNCMVTQLDKSLEKCTFWHPIGTDWEQFYIICKTIFNAIYSLYFLTNSIHCPVQYLYELVSKLFTKTLLWRMVNTFSVTQHNWTQAGIISLQYKILLKYFYLLGAPLFYKLDYPSS